MPTNWIYLNDPVQKASPRNALRIEVRVTQMTRKVRVPLLDSKIRKVRVRYMKLRVIKLLEKIRVPIAH